MNIEDISNEKQEEANSSNDTTMKYYNYHLRRKLKRCEEIKKIVSSFSALDDTDKNFNTLRESFRRFKTILEVEIIEIFNKISQRDKDVYKTIECISELTNYLLCLSNLLKVIDKIQKKINELEDNICQAKSDITIDNFDVIVIEEFYDLVAEIKKSMYEYFIRIPKKYSEKANYNPCNKVNIKNTYEEIMEQLNRIMGDVGVNKYLYKRPGYEMIISYIEDWKKKWLMMED